LASEYNKRRSLNNRSDDDVLMMNAPAVRTLQTAQVSATTANAQAPNAIESANFDVHVRLQFIDTRDLLQPVYSVMDDVLDVSEKAALKQWFEYLCGKEPKEFNPWWKNGRQVEKKCSDQARFRLGHGGRQVYSMSDLRV
jgi:phosphohistidine phosphatase SixA